MRPLLGAGGAEAEAAAAAVDRRPAGASVVAAKRDQRVGGGDRGAAEQARLRSRAFELSKEPGLSLPLHSELPSGGAIFGKTNEGEKGTFRYQRTLRSPNLSSQVSFLPFAAMFLVEWTPAEANGIHA